MSEKVLVDREQLERAASVIAWMSCRSDIKGADLKRLEQCASELSCALTAPVVQAEPVAVAITEKQVMTAYFFASRLHISGTSNWVAAFAQSLNKQIAAPPAIPAQPDAAQVEALKDLLSPLDEMLQATKAIDAALAGKGATK